MCTTARPQMIIAPPTSNQSMGQATATIKTEGGYQTVPVILQHGNNQVGNIQIQKQIGGIAQPMMQPVVSETHEAVFTVLEIVVLQTSLLIYSIV